MRTKYIPVTLLGLFLLSVGMSSCLNSEEKQTELSSNARIEHFGISPIDGKRYSFDIDQVNNVITNKDSLIISPDKRQEKLQIKVDTLFTRAYVAYGTQDSLLFPGRTITLNQAKDQKGSYETVLKTVALDKVTKRTYSLQVKVHLQDPNEYQWKKLNWRLDAEPVKAFVFKGQVFVATKNDQLWIDGSKVDLPVSILPSSIQVINETMFANDASGKVYQSSNGKDWKLCGEEVFKLVASVNNNLILGESQGKLSVSNDGKNWIVSHFPDGFVEQLSTCNSVTYQRINGQYSSFLIAGDMVWFTEDGINWAKTNIKATTLVFPYNHQLYFIHDGVGDKGEVKQDILVGLTLKPALNPIVFNKDISLENSMVIVSPDNFIYVVAKDAIWKGRLNKLGFKNQ